MKKITLFFALLAIATMASAQVKVLSNGNVGVGTTNPIGKFVVASGGYEMKFLPNNPTPEIQVNSAYLNFWHSTLGWTQLNAKKFQTQSDSSLKENILPIENATSILKRLNGYSYYFKSDPKETRQREYGILAQEIEAVLPDLVETVKGYKLVNYDGIIPFLINSFNEQQRVIEKQQAEIEILQKAVLSQEKEWIELKKLISQCCEHPKISEEPQPTNPQKAVLHQNTPNPFTASTEISCELFAVPKHAAIYIYNLQGIELKSYPVTQAGLNTITVNGSELSASMYLYTLVVDNEIIDSKRMVLTK